MPLPERISIKRRRSQEPVESLHLDHGAVRDKKRRATDFYFQRLRDETIAPSSLRERPTQIPQPAKSSASTIPGIRWTAPGDDKKDFEKLKADLKAKEDAEATLDNKQTVVDTGSRSAPATPISKEKLQAARRFHLTRHLNSGLSPNAPVGIRKQKTSIRPPLATFVERRGATFSHEENPLYRGKPVDKVLDVSQTEAPEDAKQPDLETLQASKRHATSTFLQNGSKAVRKGTSIKDHPSTWDHESDQLADELASLAMELDPIAKQEAELEKLAAARPEPKDTVMSLHEREDDYIYETYVRVPYEEEATHSLRLSDNNIGLLVIDEEDEDLWQKYVDSDEDTDWDDEDSNAEDNPANDYPEDEVSSDDEYGHNAYQYRHYASDDEAFDEDEDET
ncbi:hypothetical protein PV05_11898 [Exophiala xenobiotica]|uniref:Transcription factor Iwr1 domain-containing protein n=1 Tax=Exophiala xenobiotica TaxID=348802 RepID=A0A0D2CKC7_9EURO|nr:uncharacterized protein PV05_11898 [Exophiala xenobiotica]KIW50297.1 hypothetical protein PV05_11898 [Exophiala xenobiotica]